MITEIVNLLIEKKYHIACAESCTGGLVCAKLVEVPGVSEILDLSLVTYANTAKIKYLGVKEEDIQKYGVVSEVVTDQMARGIAEMAKSEVGLATSGIAGPGGGTPNKPVGTVCFGIYINGKTYTYTAHFNNASRNEVRNKSVEFIFNKLYELLKV